MAERYIPIFELDPQGSFKMAYTPASGFGSSPRRKTAAVDNVTTGNPVAFVEPSVLRCIADGTIVVTGFDGGTDTYVGKTGDVFDFLEVVSIAASGSGTWQRYY